MLDVSPCLEPLEEALDQKTILIIDDDVDQAEVLTYRLNQHGFSTRTAGTGEEGVKLAQQYSPDLILLDVRLPDANGIDLCHAIGDDPSTWSIPVIIVSGMESAGVVRNARTAGARFYLKKPYDPNALLILIENALGESA